MRAVSELVQLYKDLQGKKMQQRIGQVLQRRAWQNQYKINQMQRDRHLVEKDERMIESIEFHINELFEERVEIEKLNIPKPTVHFKLSHVLSELEQKRKEQPKIKGGM